MSGLIARGQQVRIRNANNDTALAHVDGALGRVSGRYLSVRQTLRYTVVVDDLEYDLAETEIEGVEP